MDRREFLKAGGLAAGFALLAQTRVAAAPTNCAPTPANPEGPFYLPGALFAEELAHPEEPGRHLRVVGRVLGIAATGCVPVTGAVLDVWHASDAGVYYGLEQRGAPEPFSLRGRVRADGNGRYAFQTILPGHYPVGRNRFRPRHLHLRVSAPGYRTLITQLYFRGDPHLSGDLLALPPLTGELTEAKEGLHCEFAFTLQPR